MNSVIDIIILTSGCIAAGVMVCGCIFILGSVIIGNIIDNNRRCSKCGNIHYNECQHIV